MPAASEPRRQPITDSPWYWLYLFCTVGLILLAVMQPKISERLAQNKTKAVGRQMAWQSDRGQDPAASPAASNHAKAWLQGLYLILGVVLVAAWLTLWRRRFRRRPERSSAASHEAAL